MSRIERLAGGIVSRRRLVLVVLTLTLFAVGAGVTQLEEGSSLPAFEVGSDAERAQDAVRSQFRTGTTNVTVAQVVVSDENVLDRSSLVRSLELQRSLRTNATVGPTLRDRRPTVGVANLVARAAYRHRNPDAGPPSIDDQIRTLESLEERQVDAILRRLLGGDAGQQADALAFLPSDYEPGSTTANATMVVVFQSADGPVPMGQAPDRIVESQLAVREIASQAGFAGEPRVVGKGVISAEQTRSRQDTMAIVGPAVLLFVLGTLALVYRDVLDVAVSLLGVFLVLVWTFGALGWLGIAFNPILIAVPVLLVGLAIDYGIHVFMRYRERRAAEDSDAPTAMAAGLAGVGGALVWVTVTTVIGFLSNLASPVGPIRTVGLISAIGIVGALVVFGGFVPPLKVALDSALEGIGFDRDQRPVGTGGGPTARVLSVGVRAAKAAPVVVLALALVVTAASAYGAANVSTSFEPEDNMAGEPPAWTEHLPASLEPGEYSAKADMQYVNDRFVRPNSQVEFLVEGRVTDPNTLERVARAERRAATRSVVTTLADGDAHTVSPLSVIQRVAATNEDFAATVAAADTDGDGVPDRSLERVFDKLYEVAPSEAARVLHREGGEYTALRLAVAVDPGADGGVTTRQAADIAAVLEGDGLSATATGRPIVSQVIQDHLLETLLVSFLVTLLAVALVLAGVFRVVHGSVTLGLVTMLPVTLVVSWIVGSMYVLGLPLSVLTTIVASLTIGIGVDYSIHVGERFRRELVGAPSVDAAVERTIRGTGSALLGSAATTAAGFGVLSLALLPTLRQFGLITALMIVYAFLGAVLVLPSLLVLWARYLGPDVVAADDVVGTPGTEPSPAAED